MASSSASCEILLHPTITSELLGADVLLPSMLWRWMPFLNRSVKINHFKSGFLIKNKYIFNTGDHASLLIYGLSSPVDGNTVSFQYYPNTALSPILTSSYSKYTHTTHFYHQHQYYWLGFSVVTITGLQCKTVAEVTQTLGNIWLLGKHTAETSFPNIIWNRASNSGQDFKLV